MCHMARIYWGHDAGGGLPVCGVAWADTGAVLKSFACICIAIYEMLGILGNRRPANLNS